MRASQKLGIAKQVENLPDSYALTLFYIDGKSESFEIASHNLGDKVLEFVTSEDVWHWVQMMNLKRVEFDKRFSKMIELKKKGI
jgi:hypothetical protein